MPSFNTMLPRKRPTGVFKDAQPSALEGRDVFETVFNRFAPDFWKRQVPPKPKPAPTRFRTMNPTEYRAAVKRNRGGPVNFKVPVG